MESVIIYTVVASAMAMREWRNWQTRTVEGRVVYTVRVQVPFLAPKRESEKLILSFSLSLFGCPSAGRNSKQGQIPSKTDRNGHKVRKINAE